MRDATVSGTFFDHEANLEDANAADPEDLFDLADPELEGANLFDPELEDLAVTDASIEDLFDREAADVDAELEDLTDASIEDASGRRWGQGRGRRATCNLAGDADGATA